MWRDVVIGTRALRRSPGFALGAITVLALSLGLNAAVFSLVNAILVRPLPVRAPSELVFVYSNIQDASTMASDELAAWRTGGAVLSDVIAVSPESRLVGDGADATPIGGEKVSSNYFDLLGVGVQRGRTFREADDLADAPPVAVISDRLWRREFDSAPDIIGRVVHFGVSQRSDTGWRYTVVGVAAPEFSGVTSPWTPTDFWLPMVQSAREFPITLDSATLISPRASLAIGRIQAGVSLPQVQGYVDRIHRTFASKEASKLPNNELVVLPSRRVRLPLDDLARIDPDRLAAGVMVVAGLVLLISVANLVGVTAARGVVRRPEVAVRLTLGATKLRLSTQLAIEGIVLATFGGLGGLMLSRGLIAAFLAATPPGVGFGALEVPLDFRVLLFTMAMVLVVGILVGIAPVRDAFRTDLLTTLKGGSEGMAGGARSRLRRWIMVPQVAACLILLMAAGSATRALVKVATMDLGYKPAGVGSILLDLPQSSLAATQAERAANRQADHARGAVVIDRVIDLGQQAPGMTSIAFTTATPLGGDDRGVVLPETYTPDGPHYRIASASVTPRYFQTIGLPLREGRTFDTRDSATAAAVVVVDETVAARFWPGRSPVGQRIGLHMLGSTRAPTWLDVVGVVGAIRHPLSEGDVRPFVYLPFVQGTKDLVLSSFVVVGRGAGSSADVLKSMRAIVKQAEPQATIARARTLEISIDVIRYPRRMATALLSSSAFFGLLLAALGLYGVVSYAVAQRVRELGIRAALGARRFDLIQLTIRDGVVAGLVGAAIGLVLAVVGFRFAAHQIYAIPALDWITAAVVGLVLLVVIVAACYLPARRASRVDPIVALRQN